MLSASDTIAFSPEVSTSQELISITMTVRVAINLWAVDLIDTKIVI